MIAIKTTALALFLDSSASAFDARAIVEYNIICLRNILFTLHSHIIIFY